MFHIIIIILVFIAPSFVAYTGGSMVTFSDFWAFAVGCRFGTERHQGLAPGTGNWGLGTGTGV